VRKERIQQMVDDVQSRYAKLLRISSKAGGGSLGSSGPASVTTSTRTTMNPFVTPAQPAMGKRSFADMLGGSTDGSDMPAPPTKRLSLGKELSSNPASPNEAASVLYEATDTSMQMQGGSSGEDASAADHEQPSRKTGELLKD
jgi:hypothetical protein